MHLHLLNNHYSVCKLTDLAEIDWAGEITFVGKTDEELSLVCETRCVPPNALIREDGWRALRVEGVLDFSLVGILSGISGTLAAAGISLFCVSTYNTDYVLIKEGSLSGALQALRSAGYTIA